MRDRQFEAEKIVLAELTDKRGRPFRCAVCGEFIRGSSKEDFPRKFNIDRIQGLDGKSFDLYCHGGRCEQAVVDAGQAGRWQVLPDGPLRRTFQHSVDQQKRTHDADKELTVPDRPKPRTWDEIAADFEKRTGTKVERRR